MRRRLVIRVLGGVVLGLVVLVVAAWLAFVPFAKEPAYAFVTAWGEKGDGPGEFHDPNGIAVAGGEVFVADSRNGRIQVFDREGSFRRQFGAPGHGPGALGRPMNLTVHDGKLYVPEYFNDRVQVFTLAGEPVRTIGAPGDGDGRFNAPGGVAVTTNGHLLVADFYNQRVQELRPDGGFVRQWGRTGEPGFGAGEFIYPTDVAAGADGSFYVADGYADRVQKFAADGAFLAKWGGPFGMNIYGPFNGWFITVTSVAVGPEGNVFVADFYNHRIQKFAPDGTFLTAFGEEGSGPGQFEHASAVAVAADGTVYATDMFNHRVEVWRPRTAQE